jgi:glycosyltransferase involved in cell wall biosynthesis
LKIPPCIQITYDPGLRRSDFNLPENAFLFLCAYDVLSVQDRKNPQAAIESFKKIFDPDNQSVGLVIKINNAKLYPDEVQRLKDGLAGYTNCYFLEEIYQRQKFNSLVNLTNVYISLHRSEGFGLIPAESMYLGKPVIMTNWSGNVDFMTGENSCGVNYKLIPVVSNAETYSPDQLWADPDIDQAAYFMKKLYCDPGYYSTISTNAQDYIREKYSADVIGKMIRDRLTQIKLI